MLLYKDENSAYGAYLLHPSPKVYVRQAIFFTPVQMFGTHFPSLNDQRVHMLEMNLALLLQEVGALATKLLSCFQCLGIFLMLEMFILSVYCKATDEVLWNAV